MRRDNRGVSDPHAHTCWRHCRRCDGYALIPCWCEDVAAADRPGAVCGRRINRNPFVHAYLLRELWTYGAPAAPAVGPVAVRWVPVDGRGLDDYLTINMRQETPVGHAVVPLPFLCQP